MLHHMPRLITAALGLGLLATPAYARMTPNPPPSGIVIHLFGPDSVTSHLMPGAPAAQPAPGSPAATPGTPGATPTADTTPAAPGPTLGDVAHQMFVVGDPAQENGAGAAKGKAGQ